MNIRSPAESFSPDREFLSFDSETHRVRPRILNGLILFIGILLWILITIYHGLGAMVNQTDVATLSFQVGDIWYRFLQVGFILAHALLISRLFANIERLHVTTLLWRLFMIGMTGILVVMLITFGNRLLRESTLYPYFQALFFSLGYYALVIFLLSGVFIFRRFILFPRTRRKLFFWKGFVGILGLALLFHVLQPFGLSPGPLVIGVFIVFLIIVLLLSANVRWIPYLNFNQKLRALGLFVLVEIVCVTFIVAADRLPDQLNLLNINRYLPEELLTFSLIYVMVYSGFSILVLFFNLPTTSVFESNKIEIASFSKINQAIQSNLDFTEIIGTLLDACMMETGARGGWVEWLDEHGASYVRNKKRITDQDLDQLKIDFDVTEKVLRDQKFLLIRNTRKHKALRTNSTRFRSVLCVPLLSSSKNFGVLYLANDLVNAFEDVSVQTVVNFAEQAGIALENAELIKNSIEVERYQEQLKIAKEVQDKLLPTSLPQNDRIEFKALSENAYEVGGDYFDVSQFQEHTFRVAIGDVSGKGTTAAFYMAEVKGIFHALTQLNLSVRQFIATANQALAECLQQGFFVTLTYLEIDVRRRRIEMIRAGHTPTFFYSAESKSIRSIREGTLGLGLVRTDGFANYINDPTVIDYDPGDLLVLYTDGIVEARNEEGEEFGYDRLQEIIEQDAESSVEVLSEKVVKGVKSFASKELDDDYTVLIIRLK